MQIKPHYKRIPTGYVPRDWQQKVHNLLKRHNVLVFHRRGGKTVLAVNEMIDQAIRFNKKDPKTGIPYRDPTYAFVATTVGQVEKIAWSYFKHYLEHIPGVKFNESKLRATFPHPAGICTIYCFGAENFDSFRGIYLDGYALDEFANMHPDVRDKVFLPMLSDRKGWEIIIGTPKGDNNFKDLYDRALANPERWFTCLHKASETGIIDDEELAMLKETMSEEAYNQEYECDFNAAPSGKYYQKYMDDAMREGRITDVPHNQSSLVNTYWDMGRDGMSLWFVQETGREVHVIRYWEEVGKGLEAPVDFIKQCEDEFGYRYNEHIVPHDADHHELQTNQTRIEFLEAQGLKNVRALERTSNIGEDIHAVRVILRHCYFDKKNCNPYIHGRLRGIASLKDYSKKYDTKLKVYHEKPTHNWASHGCDAFRQFALDYQPGFGRSVNAFHGSLPSTADHEYDILG